jgi:hypothetical protein
MLTYADKMALSYDFFGGLRGDRQGECREG